MQVPLLDLKAQYQGLRESIRTAMDEVCDAQYFILGPRVAGFEERVAEYCGAVDAVGVSSGSDALIVALMAHGIGPGDAVITTPYSFFATAGSIVRLGATPVFVDIDPVTYNIDPDKVRELLDAWPERFQDLTPRALMPVHLYGQCADMDPLLALANEHELVVIEDACQAIGAEYPGSTGVMRAGGMGDCGCFSFFPSKNLGGFGDGGMVTVKDADMGGLLRKLRNHGSDPKYYHPMVGGNFRLDALQAVVLDAKLPCLDGWHAARRANAERYDAAFAGTVVKTPQRVYADRDVKQPHIYNQYVIRVPHRDAVRAYLGDQGVGCEIYYPVPLHLQECFANLGYGAGDFVNTELAAAETLALPIYPELTDEMQDHVVATVLAGIESA